MTDQLTEAAKRIAERETKALLDTTQASARLYERAVGSMPYGVASTFQANDPYPMYLARGEGARVWDVDGTERIDFHGGFGCNVVGHANPRIVAAIDAAARTGTHFAVTTEKTVALAEEICRRFGLESMRFTNSGTESTMDAIRVARGFTGRDTVLKIEGSYHGHHDTVMFSVVPNSDALGSRELPSTTPMSKGIPADVADHTKVVRFNDLDALERVLGEHGAEIACLIMEPVMMNVGVVLPDDGYLAGAKELCGRHGVLLIFDEVKSGGTIAAGGATERYGVQPDLVCLAKAMGGGTPLGAFGGRADVMHVIEEGVAQQGTFNGNPLVCAAGLAALTEVLTPDAYTHLGKLGTRLAEGCAAIVARHGIPAHAVDLGAKGCVSYRAEPLHDYRDFLDTNPALFEASFPYMNNRGIFLTPGDEEQWTLSVAHTEADIDAYLGVFDDFCAELAG